MIRGADLCPAYEPSADFAERVVVAALRERRRAEKRTALFGVASASLAAFAALGCLMLEVRRGCEREKAVQMELVEEERARQARLDAHAEKMAEMMRAVVVAPPPEEKRAPSSRPGANVP